MSLDINNYKKTKSVALGSQWSVGDKKWFKWLETFIQDIKQYGEDNYMSSTSPKRFKALLTQSGTTTPTTQTSGLLVVGTTYEITDYNANDNFMNVGAPSNELGVKFIATGTTPAVWSKSSELTYDTATPKAVVLENTIGNVWFEFSANGIYTINSNNLFTANKTFKLINSGLLLDEGLISFTNAGTTSLMNIVSYDSSVNPANDLLLNTPILVEVYP